MFQSTPPHGERRRPVHPAPPHHLVSIHAPARGATASVAPVSSFPIVSIHAPARGATSRSGAGRCLPRVSIHAPARGATESARSKTPSFFVSIHAPARGATRSPPGGCAPEACFNPRPRTGSDRVPRQDLEPVVAVSIHAPARGATPGLHPRGGTAPRFNPRPRTGSDWSRAWYLSPPLRFQSTPPHGERRGEGALSAAAWLFQSTPPHGERRRQYKSNRFRCFQPRLREAAGQQAICCRSSTGLASQVLSRVGFNLSANLPGRDLGGPGSHGGADQTRRGSSTSGKIGRAHV